MLITTMINNLSNILIVFESWEPDNHWIPIQLYDYIYLRTTLTLINQYPV